MLVAEDVGVIVANGALAHLTRSEMDILLALRDCAPAVMSKERLLAKTNRDITGHDERDLKLVDVWICKLRKKLKPLGVEIVTAWGQGYRLAVNQGETA